MSAIRLQIDSLDAKIAQLQELFGHDEVYEGPIDLDIEDDLPADNADIPAETSPAEAFQQVLPEGLSWSDEPSREEHPLPVHDCLTDEPSVQLYGEGARGKNNQRKTVFPVCGK